MGEDEAKRPRKSPRKEMEIKRTNVTREISGLLPRRNLLSTSERERESTRSACMHVALLYVNLQGWITTTGEKVCWIYEVRRERAGEHESGTSSTSLVSLKNTDVAYSLLVAVRRRTRLALGIISTFVRKDVRRN